MATMYVYVVQYIFMALSLETCVIPGKDNARSADTCIVNIKLIGF